MGFLSRALRGSIEGSSGVATPEKWLVEWMRGGEKSASGVLVDTATALSSTAFFGAVRVVSEDIGALPRHLYERQGDRGKRRATDHPLHEILHDAPNPLMTSAQFFEALQGHQETWGTAYASIERDRGRVVGLWPLRPDRVTPEVRRTGPSGMRVTWRYDDHENDIHVRLLPDEILHVPGFGADGIRGYSLIALHKNALGLSVAMERYGSAFFKNGSRPGGVLQRPDNGKRLSDDARKRMKSDFEELHQGLDNAQRIAILEEGVTWQSVGIPNDDAQFIEGRTFQVQEMSRMTRVPPHKLAELSRATFSNIEDQGRDYVVSSLRPRLVRWEQAFRQQLLTTRERDRFFAEHLVDALLRGDTKSRYDAYATGRQWGWLSADDIREKENMDPIEDGSGAAYLVPLNTTQAPKPGDDPDDDRAAAGGQRRRRSMEGRRRIARRFSSMVEDLDRRIARMEQAEVGSLVRRHLDNRSAGEFTAELEELYETLGSRARERWAPVMESLALEIAADTADEMDVDADEDRISRFAGAYATSHVAHMRARSVGEITELLSTSDDPAAAINARLDEWVADRPAQTVRWQTVQLPEATAREVYDQSGVRRLRWVGAGDDTCPFCSELDGTVVGIEQPFLAAGAELGAGGQDQPMTSARNVFHPPVHTGCECQIKPEATTS